MVRHTRIPRTIVGLAAALMFLAAFSTQAAGAQRAGAVSPVSTPPACGRFFCVQPLDPVPPQPTGVPSPPCRPSFCAQFINPAVYPLSLFNAHWEYRVSNADLSGPCTGMADQCDSDVPVLVIDFTTADASSPILTLGTGQPDASGQWPFNIATWTPTFPHAVTTQHHYELYPADYNDQAAFAHWQHYDGDAPGHGHFDYNNADRFWIVIRFYGSGSGALDPYVMKLFTS
jgi:hypothetical protein